MYCFIQLFFSFQKLFNRHIFFKLLNVIFHPKNYLFYSENKRVKTNWKESCILRYTVYGLIFSCCLVINHTIHRNAAIKYFLDSHLFRFPKIDMQYMPLCLTVTPIVIITWDLLYDEGQVMTSVLSITEAQEWQEYGEWLWPGTVGVSDNMAALWMRCWGTAAVLLPVHTANPKCDVCWDGFDSYRRTVIRIRWIGQFGRWLFTWIIRTLLGGKDGA